MEVLLMILGLSLIPFVGAYLLGNPQMGGFGTVLTFVYLAVESEIGAILGVGIFVIVVLCMYLGLQLAEQIGVGSSG